MSESLVIMLEYKLTARVCSIYQKGDFKNAEETFKVPEK
jgi:hypothetical protein